MKATAALARNDDDDIQSKIEHLRDVRDRLRRSAPVHEAARLLDTDALPFEKATSEELHRSLTAQYDALGAAEQLVIREIVADHKRLNAYESTLCKIMAKSEVNLRQVERLENLREIASRSFHRGLDTLRVLKVAATPIVVQAAPKNSGRVDVRVVGGRGRRRR